MLVVAASAPGEVAVLCLDQTADSSDRALVALAMLKDVSNAVTYLQLLPHPAFVAAFDTTVAPADAAGKASAAGDTEPLVVNDNLTDDTARECEKSPEWILCACAATDSVHMWTLSVDAQPEPADLSNPSLHARGSKQVATYCGALKGVGHTAAPLCMRVVGGHRQAHAQEEEAADVCLDASHVAPWLVVACTDRSIRAWPVTSKLLDMHRVATLSQPAHAVAAAAKDGVHESHAEPQAAPSARNATSLTVCQDESEDVQAPQPVHAGAACTDEAVTAAQPCSAAKSSVTSVISQRKPATQTDASLMSSDQHKSAQTCLPLAPAQHSAANSGCNDQEDSPTVHGEARCLTSQGVNPPSSVLNEPQTQCQLDASAKPCADSIEESSVCTTEPSPSDAKPESSEGNLQAHAGCRSGSEQSVASQLSKFVGISKTAEVARLRPRACMLGTQPILQRFVDDKLNHHECSCLPGAALSSVDSERMLSDLATFVAADEVVVDKGPGKASKAAAGIRNAAAGAAQRAALIHLWQGDVCAAVDTVVEADALNADFVAMAMGAGPEVWREVVALYAAQLAACGEVHLAAGYLCSAGAFEQAVRVYMVSGLLLEALVVGERHLPPSSTLLCTLRSLLQKQLAQFGGFEQAVGVESWAVEVSVANGDVQGALQMLVRQDGVCSESVLSRACDMLASKGYHDASAEVACRVALGSTSMEVQKQWLGAALRQDVGVACVAAAIGNVQELISDLLDHLIRVVLAERANVWSEVAGAVSRSCSRIVGSLQPAQHRSAANIPVLTVPAVVLQNALSRAVDAIIGAVAQSQAQSDGGAYAAHDCAQEQLQELAQSILCCVACPLSCINSEGLLPGHLEDLSSSVQRMLPSLVLSHADKHAAKTAPLELAAALVAVSLDVAAVGQDVLGASSVVSGASQPSDSALHAWERCAARKCSVQYSLASGGVGDGNILSTDSLLQQSVWQFTVMEFQRTARPQDTATGANVEQSPVVAAAESLVAHSKAAEPAVAEECAVPEVSVLDSALQELGDLPTAACDPETDPSPYRTPDSAGSWTESGATSSPERRRKGRAWQASHRSAAKVDDLHWSVVEQYQRTVQAYTPQDWAVFRQEALAGGHVATVFATAASDASVQVQELQAQVLSSGAVELEPPGEGPAVPQQQPRASVEDGSDIVVEGWLGALQLHPGRSRLLS